MKPAARPRPTILCPLEFERAALDDAAITDHAELICCGPGPANLVRWAESEGAGRQRVILAGLAGSLRETFGCGEAFIAATVMAPKGGQYRSAAEVTLPNGKPVRRAVIASSETVLTTPGEKRALAERTGADLVDLESAVFAEAAGIFGWRWTVVRGVSDGAGETLPPGIGTWVGDHGRTRGLGVALGVLRRPWIIPRLFALRGSGAQAMQSVREIVAALLAADHSDC